MLKNVRIGVKLTGGFLLVALIGAVTGGIGILQVSRVGRSADVIYEEQYPVVRSGTRMQNALEAQLRLLHSFLLGERDASKDFADASAEFAAGAEGIEKGQPTSAQAASLTAIRRRHAEFDERAKKAMAAKEAADTAERESADKMEEMDAAGEAFTARLIEKKIPAERVDQAWQEIMTANDYIIRQGAPEEKATHARLKASIQGWPEYGLVRSEQEALEGRIEGVFTAYDAHLAAEKDLDSSMKEADELARGLQAQAAAFVEEADRQMGEAMKSADETQSSSRTLLAIVVTLSFALAILIGLGVSRETTGRLSQLVQDARTVGAGDLTREVTGAEAGDEIGALAAAFRDMVVGLRGQTRELIEGVSVLGSAAAEISASVSQLASGAAETAAAVSETTATVEEVKQTSQLANQKARQVSDTARRTVQVSQEGQKAAHQTREEIDRIRHQMESIADSIVRLSEQSQTIGEIIVSVEDLAEQSNLLAVNAAVEAAKAGEQGRGFSVVAQEIKSLAEQSKQATGRVRTILGDIQKATSAAVMATEQGTKAVEVGVKQSRETGDSIRALGESVSEAAQAATQIAASSQQQFAGIDQVTTAMENIKQAATQNVESTKLLEASAANLRELGGRLKDLAARYRV